MTAPHDPDAGDPQTGYRSADSGPGYGSGSGSGSGSSPLSGSYDATAGYQGTGYPSSPVQYPAPGSTGQFAPVPGHPASSGAQPYDPATYSPPPYSPPTYGQSPYAAPAYGAPFPFGAAPRNGMGTAALVLGIISVVLSWTVWGGVILGALAIIFGSIGLGRAKRGEATNRSSAMAGLILGIVAIALLVLLIVAGLGLYASTTGVSSTS